jgi:hypothetical protein
MIWKPFRGEYALQEDEAYQWRDRRIAIQKWPPIKEELNLKQAFSKEDFVEVLKDDTETFDTLLALCDISDSTNIRDIDAIYFKVDGNKVSSLWVFVGNEYICVMV